MNERPTHIDLFSGIGGFALSAQWAGFQTVAFCEIDAYCQAILKERFGAVMADACCGGRRRRGEPSSTRAEAALGSPRLHADIRTLNGQLYVGAALLTGGFPCQPFSVAGKRAGAADDRFLWPEMLRVIDEARPSWVLGENVAGIVQMELDRVLSDLESLGYSCWPLVIPACAVDARHRRDRVWIVGYANNPSRTAQPQRGIRDERRRTCDASYETRRSKQQSWSTQCGLGGMVDGLPVWMDEPADIPRVTKGQKNRSERLKGLGNAIVPAVAFEILSAIRTVI